LKEGEDDRLEEEEDDGLGEGEDDGDSRIHRYCGGFIVIPLIHLFILLLLSSSFFAQSLPLLQKSRPAVFAAQGWYSQDKATLSRVLDKALSKVSSSKPQARVLGIIAPHAGYRYSLETATQAYGKLRGLKFERIYLLGPSHRAKTGGMAIFPTASGFETPLGTLPVDLAMIQKIQKSFPKIFSTEDRIHLNEHSLEMQLPLIFRIFGKTPILPLILPSDDLNKLLRIGGALSKFITDKDLVVLSTDLSHYPALELANQVDQNALDSWITMSPRKVFETEIHWQKSGKVACSMCGVSAVVVGLEALKQAHLNARVEIIHRSTSFDATGDASRVVGYGSALILASDKLGKQERKILLKIARLTLDSHFKGGEFQIQNEGLEKLKMQGYGVFVTMKNQGRLRGCIGCFTSEKPLFELVSEYTIHSTQDWRFRGNPVTAKEIQKIELEISVLSPLRLISNYRDARLGVHGIVVEKGPKRGVFLPQVATDTGWSLEEFWSHCANDKAGLAPKAYLDPSVKLYVFEAEVFSESEFR
jgi:MEMO1 family protein